MTARPLQPSCHNRGERRGGGERILAGSKIITHVVSTSLHKTTFTYKYNCGLIWPHLWMYPHLATSSQPDPESAQERKSILSIRHVSKVSNFLLRCMPRRMKQWLSVYGKKGFNISAWTLCCAYIYFLCLFDGKKRYRMTKITERLAAKVTKITFTFF